MLATLAALPLAACGGTTPPPAVGFQPPPARPSYGPVGLERVMGKDAAQLTALFGHADADVSEGTGRKLQFQSAICVLDAYLYPGGGKGAVVTHVDARQTDGSPIDRASCVAAIARRGGGK
ncbi:hypothetical protein ACLB0R_03270 [Sphingomonas sp. GlSt437]